ncbi:hypothetical protein [Aliiglaciecola litoralis]|uniref:Tetratricopeptide repeat protein n=1 Tax=Aliiglaciecola litoralis TaxID=582857 RepID=A0ABN1LRW9_9ALTE
MQKEINHLSLSRCVLLFIILLSGCQSSNQPLTTSEPTQPKATLNWQIPELPKMPVHSVDDIFALSREQQQHFLNYYYAPENQTVAEHKRLFNYLESILSGFDYRGDTLIARNALEDQNGNCMSLAIVTSALAKLVGLDVRYQRVNSAPIYQRFNNVMTLSSHVRTHLYQPKIPSAPNEIVIVRAKLVIDYFPENTNVSGDFIEAHDFLSMYYQNMAGDAMVKNDHATAYANLSAAMKIDPNNSETLNTLAVLHKSRGAQQVAERIYQYALAENASSVNLLSNYAILLEEQGRTKEWQALQDRLTEVEDDNPYRWYDVANRQFSKQNFAIALKYYKRSIEVAPYLHEGYFGLAKTYYQIGMLEQAADMMKKASELAFTPNDEYLYQAKLKVLSAKESDS